MIKLKDCPICGGTPHIESFMVYPQSHDSYRVYFAVCNHCGARTKSVPARIMAVLQWNNMKKS